MASKKKGPVVGEVEGAKAASHPLRQALLTALQETASPNELAVLFKEPLGNVSYHVRHLLNLGCIELIDTTPRRGAIEHYYRAKVKVSVLVEELA